MKYMADAFYSKEEPCQMESQCDLRQRSYWPISVLTIAMRYVADVYYPKQRRQRSYKVDAAIANHVAIANY